MTRRKKRMQNATYLAPECKEGGAEKRSEGADLLLCCDVKILAAPLGVAPRLAAHVQPAPNRLRICRRDVEDCTAHASKTAPTVEERVWCGTSGCHPPQECRRKRARPPPAWARAL
eukprot:1384906-Rhodomonas_salina.1